MAARFRPKKYTFVSTDPVSLQTILNNAHDDYIGSLVLRAGKANVADVYWCDSTGEEGGYLQAKEAANVDLVGKFVFGGHFYLKAAVGDVIFITVLA